MLYIDPTSKRIADACDEHFRAVYCLIHKRLNTGSKCKNDSCKICSPKSRLEPVTYLHSKIKDVLTEDSTIKDLVCGNPQDLLRTNKAAFDKIFSDIDLVEVERIKTVKQDDRTNKEKDVLKKYNDRFKQLSNVVDYEDWFVNAKPDAYYSAYHLAKNLDRRTCTFCNRTYTVTQTKQEKDKKKTKKGKLMRPQFDHWFSKEEYPLLGLSFYNLIPSCSICNSSIKGRLKFNLDDHIHPYLDNIIDKFEFSYEHWMSINQFKIKYNIFDGTKDEKERIEKTLKAFHIDEMYDAHHSELNDLLLIERTYSKNYLDILKKSFPDINLTSQEIYRLAFGTEMDSANFHKRPMSKFKYDILKRKGFIHSE